MVSASTRLRNVEQTRNRDRQYWLDANHPWSEEMGTGRNKRIRTRERGGKPGKSPWLWVGDVGTVLAGLGFGATIGLALTAETHSELVATGGIAIFAGNLTALAGTYLVLVMVLLVSRIPVIERAIGQDRLVRWHRRLSPWPLTLLAAHAVLTTVGYAQAGKTGFLHQIGIFINSYPDMLAAVIAFGMMLGIGFASVRAVRNRVRRETWWTIHLCMYLALALAFAHEIALGPSFVGHPLTRTVWIMVWILSAGVVLVYRVGLPIVRTIRHRLRVVDVRDDAPGVVSIVCSGRHLDRLAVSGGQFMLWRFLARGIWWQAHPYSISALPQPPYIRLTVKEVGDHSAAVARLRPGTRIVIEGPYGAFTRHAQHHKKAVLIAAGIGVTALRSLLEDLPGGSNGSHPIVIVRASRPSDLVFHAELVELVKHRRGELHEIVGSREKVHFDEDTLVSLVPNLDQRDLYVCGPEGFVDRVVEIAGNLGVSRESIHHEAFSL